MLAMRRRSLNAWSSVAPRSSSSGSASAWSSGVLQSWTMVFTAASTCTSKRPLSTRAADRRALASSKASWAARARARASLAALVHAAGGVLRGGGRLLEVARPATGAGGELLHERASKARCAPAPPCFAPGRRAPRRRRRRKGLQIALAGVHHTARVRLPLGSVAALSLASARASRTCAACAQRHHRLLRLRQTRGFFPPAPARGRPGAARRTPPRDAPTPRCARPRRAGARCPRTRGARPPASLRRDGRRRGPNRSCRAARRAPGTGAGSRPGPRHAGPSAPPRSTPPRSPARGRADASCARSSSRRPRAGEHAIGVVNRRGTPTRHLAVRPHHASAARHETHAEGVAGMGGERRVDVVAYHHVAQQRLHGAGGLVRVGQLVDRARALGPAGRGAGARAAPRRARRAGDEHHLALLVAGRQRGRHGRGLGGVVHQQRRHVRLPASAPRAPRSASARSTRRDVRDGSRFTSPAWSSSHARAAPAAALARSTSSRAP